MSEDVASVISPDDRNESPTSSSDWTSINHTEVCQEFISKGPPKAEVQLRFDLLHLVSLTSLELNLAQGIVISQS